MKSSSWLLVALCVVVGMASFASALRNPLMQIYFTDFQAKYKKTYKNKTKSDEAFSNFAVEKTACKQQEQKFLNKASTFRMDVNVRSDESLDQKSSWFGLPFDAVDRAAAVEPRAEPSFPPAPASLDYRTLGYVSDVLDQGYVCGSCYSFGSLCAIEGQLRKMNSASDQLSVQSIIDCTRPSGNHGCDVSSKIRKSQKHSKIT
jgi:C1A family cysteine protease